jgi:hypothetical protein
LVVEELGQEMVEQILPLEMEEVEVEVYYIIQVL